METTFENAKVGDKVWSYHNGWGVIYSITSPPYPIIVDFSDAKLYSFTLDGVEITGERQTLFWDEVKFEIPTRPKKRVKKEGWININKMCIHETKEMALHRREALSTVNSDILTIPITWEEEE